MRIYLSGKMRGLPDHGHDIFTKYATLLRSEGSIVISPAEMDKVPVRDKITEEIDLVTWEKGFYYPDKLKEENDQLFYAKRDIQALLKCDAIAMIPGWETSMGAKAERAVAEWVGLFVMELTTIPDEVAARVTVTVDPSAIRCKKKGKVANG